MTPPFPLSTPLGALTDDLGCFPLDATELIPRRLTAMLHVTGIRSLAGIAKMIVPHQPTSRSTTRNHHTTLHLNAFRGEPAITEFDWPFTPTHSSSPRFSTQVGTVLHALLHTPQPGHG